jgi:hypothetical protein
MGQVRITHDTGFCFLSLVAAIGGDDPRPSLF